MLTFPALNPRRRRRRLATDAPPAPAPALVTVVSVTMVNGHQARFVFSDAVTCDGSGNGQIIIHTTEGPDSSVESVQVNVNTILFWFDGFPDPGDAWSIDAVPEGLDFHGRELVVPQAGVVG